MNGATGVSIDADLSWTGGDPDPGDTVTYDVYFGTDFTPMLVAEGLSTPSYDPGPLAFETTYYWNIVSIDNHEASTTGDIWEFTTEPVIYGSLSGYVRDTSMNPLPNARVRVSFHETYEEDYTDDTGYYHVANIPLCYCLKNASASKAGYATEWVLLSIGGDDVYDFALAPVGYDYVPGDVNGDGLVLGSDVTYLVSYFRGIMEPQPEWLFGPDNFWAGADANGDCQVIGSDITYLVSYFRGIHSEIQWCPQYPPMS